MGELETEIVALLRAVPLYCDELGLICKEHCAVDGCRLPTATELFYKLLRRAR